MASPCRLVRWSLKRRPRARPGAVFEHLARRVALVPEEHHIVGGQLVVRSDTESPVSLQCEPAAARFELDQPGNYRPIGDQAAVEHHEHRSFIRQRLNLRPLRAMDPDPGGGGRYLPPIDSNTQTPREFPLPSAVLTCLLAGQRLAPT